MKKKAFVYMSESVYNRMVKHIFINPRYECGGFLIGNRIDLEDALVFSVREIYCENLCGTMSSFEFDADYAENAHEFTRCWQDERECDDFIMGTFHSHAGYDAFVSKTDEVYAKKYNLMIICSPTTRRIEVWYWSLMLSRWFECELIVYENSEEPADVKPVFEEATTLRLGSERFPMCIYHKKRKISKAPKRIVIVGCGTLGNLLARHIVDSNLNAETTWVDRDRYEKANLPRSPMIDINAVGKPKAFALAEAVTRAGHNLHPVCGIVVDVRKLSLNFFEQFDAIVTPLDNLECRFYLSYVASVLKKPLINLGTSYVGLNGTPSFSGDVYYKPSRSSSCLDCFYPLYKSNEAILKKRVSCGGALPEEVSPQVISSSMLIASLAFLCIKRALAYDNSTFSTGYNVSDVVMSESFFDKAPVKKSGCCSFSRMHDLKLPIKTITVSPRTQLKTLYRLIKHELRDDSPSPYELDMMASCLSFLKYRVNNPIHSICLDDESIGRLYHVIGGEYFPSDHVYAVCSSSKTEYIRIKIK